MKLENVLLRPVLTEKSTRGMDVANQYVFEVASQSNKVLVRRAVEELFDVKVAKVNMRNRKGKLKRVGRSVGYTKRRKEAIVTLRGSDKLDVY